MHTNELSALCRFENDGVQRKRIFNFRGPCPNREIQKRAFDLFIAEGFSEFGSRIRYNGELCAGQIAVVPLNFM